MQLPGNPHDLSKEAAKRSQTATVKTNNAVFDRLRGRGRHSLWPQDPSQLKKPTRLTIPTQELAGTGSAQMRALLALAVADTCRQEKFAALRHSPEDDSFVVSVPNGNVQPAHIDQPVDDKLQQLAGIDPCGVGLSVLIFPEGGSLVYWPRSHIRIVMPRMSMAVLYATMVHAGDKHLVRNIRWHYRPPPNFQ